MVSNPNTGFPIPESRHKSRSIERIKMDDDNAPSGISETGSERSDRVRIFRNPCAQ
jgi:hypothetical protein